MWVKQPLFYACDVTLFFAAQVCINSTSFPSKKGNVSIFRQGIGIAKVLGIGGVEAGSGSGIGIGAGDSPAPIYIGS